MSDLQYLLNEKISRLKQKKEGFPSFFCSCIGLNKNQTVR